MIWLLVPRKGVPVFSGVITVKAGGIDEKKGKTGIAHLFEHMAFKGSHRLGSIDFNKEKPILNEIELLARQAENIEQYEISNSNKSKQLWDQISQLQKKAATYQIKNEFDIILNRNGGFDENAATSKDITYYHASVPSDRLTLWMHLMAELITAPTFRQFYLERDVVANERRDRMESQPAAQLYERLFDAAYVSGPYKWSTIGFMNDINNLTIADARKYHTTYYVPNNMVGTLVGEFDIKQAKKLIKSVFGKLPTSKRPIPEPMPTIARYGQSINMSLDASSKILIAYHKPTFPSKDSYAVDVLAHLLCGSRSSRLKEHLVYKKRMASQVYCFSGTPGERQDNLFIIQIDTLNSANQDDVIYEVQKTINDIVEHGVSKRELQKVQNAISTYFVFGLMDNMDLAKTLAEVQAISSDWRLLQDYPNELARISSTDITHAIKRYITKDLAITVKQQANALEGK